MNKIKYYCIDCGKRVSTKYTKRCTHCAKIGKLNPAIKGKRNNKCKHNPAYIDGRTLKEKYCMNCNKLLIDYQAIRCRSCAQKNRLKNPKNHPNYKDGRTNKLNFCINCGCKINDYRHKRCYNCDVLRRMNYKEGVFQEYLHKQTLPESQIEKLIESLKLNFKYVGNGKKWINGFNPDFIDEKQFLIIEVFGDYWHNKLEVKKKDKGRIACYLKNGYKLLIIWEHELKNIKNVIKKIIYFVQSKEK